MFKNFYPRFIYLKYDWLFILSLKYSIAKWFELYVFLIKIVYVWVLWTFRIVSLKIIPISISNDEKIIQVFYTFRKFINLCKRVSNTRNVFTYANYAHFLRVNRAVSAQYVLTWISLESSQRQSQICLDFKIY